MNSNLLKLGWNEHFQNQLESHSNNELIPARIIREDRGQYIIHNGIAKESAQLSGSFRNSVQQACDLPTIGDWVLVDKHRNIIQSILERSSLFTRQASGKSSENQLLAANIDYLFIVTGLDRDYNPKRIQRYLTQAWDSGAEPVVILNKSDLVENLNQIMKELKQLIPNAPIHALSALYMHEIECLDPYLRSEKTIALSGSSGVGKSSLINALLGEQRLQTQANRSHDSRGRHTTTWRELILLNDKACMIDLPGMRELQLTGNQMGITKAFLDISMIAQQCRYRNCRHQDEPGCAVQEALDKGDLSIERYNQYLKLSLENTKAKKNNKQQKPSKMRKTNKWEEKNSFFKEVTVQHKKNMKAKRKFNQLDGF